MPRKIERWLAVFDSHGDHIDPKTAEVILRFKAAFKPDLIIHGGDAFDLRNLRRGASEEERREDIERDIDTGCDFMAKLKPHVWTLGNHDWRLNLAMQHADARVSRAAKQDWARIKSNLRSDIRIIPYNKRKVFRYADTNFLHGFYGGAAAAINTARSYGKSCAGHCHRVDVASAPNLNGATCYLSGAACKLDADYNSAQPGTLAQSSGFIFGFKLHGTLSIYQARNEKGTWILPTGFQALQT